MTIDEIRALVSAKIAGQGSAVDAGGALPAILGGILDGIGSLKISIDKSIKKIEDAAAYERACQRYLTIEIIENSTQLSWLFPSGYDTSHAATIEWSADNGITWTSVTADESDTNNIGTFNAGDKIIFRGSGATGFLDEGEGEALGSFFNANKSCYVYGNVMSLLYGDNFASQREITQSEALAGLFSDYNGDYSGDWVLMKQDTPLVLPATTLADRCYSYMFDGCTSLTSAPELPAITLADYCYYYMFSGCTSLTSAPELPAITLAYYCYSGMFDRCTSLTSAPELPATTLADRCYSYMFDGCTSLTSAPELPAITLAYYCYSGMFSGCTSLTSAPELPATTLADYCYYYMFDRCTSLTSAPELPATTLADYCYSYMFNGCTSLARVKCLAAAVTPSNAVSNWLYNVAATGIFTKAAGVEWPSGGSGIPSGWEVVEV